MSRPSRPSPRELDATDPEAALDDPVAATARDFIKNLRDAVGGRSLRQVGALTGVHFSTLQSILEGRAWPDLYTIAKLESGLDTKLWPR